MIFHSLIICAISTISVLFTEAISWYFIFSKPDFQKLKSKIEKANKLINKLKGEGKDVKKRKQLEKDLQKDNAKLAGMRLFGLIALSVVMYAVYQTLRSIYHNVVVAKLPFTPFAIFLRITHAGIETADNRDCGMTFIYSLCTLVVRSCTQRIIGDGNPKGAKTLFEQIAEIDKNVDD